MCNMSIEGGARAGMVAPDDKTFEFLRGRPYAPQGDIWEEALRAWRQLPSDPDAVFDKEVVIDVEKIIPQVTWGISPEHVVGVDGRIPDPQADATFASAKLNWDEIGKEPHAGWLEWYSSLLGVRRAEIVPRVADFVLSNNAARPRSIGKRTPKRAGAPATPSGAVLAPPFALVSAAND